MTTKEVGQLRRGDEFEWNGIVREVSMKDPLDGCDIEPKAIGFEDTELEKISYERLMETAPVRLFVIEPDGSPGELVLRDDEEVEVIDD